MMILSGVTEKQCVEDR